MKHKSIGGKADGLNKLTAGGFMVPRFFACSQNVSEESILKKIDLLLPGVEYFAVRSSAANEDSSDKSFAGYFYSAIGIPKKDVYKEIKKVRLSYKGMTGSVVVQEFIPSDKAGVMFSEVESGQAVINAIQGLCSTVVNGDACDEYILDKNGNIIDTVVQTKKVAKIFNGHSIISKTYKKMSLNEDEVKELYALAKKIQSYFSSPQDIEWCYKGEKLYVLQSRPITQSFSASNKVFFDSANIAESYSGIVLPLTCSFAQSVYSQAYRDLLKMSGVPAKKIEKHIEIFDGLLGFFYGRMYYNMNNWYRMAAFAPGYRRNKANFEQMITSNVKQDVPIDIYPSVLLKIVYPLILLLKIGTYWAASRYFKIIVKYNLKKLRNTDFTLLNYVECIKLFNEINNRMLRHWYIALENDFFVMTYLGALTKIIDGDRLQELITFKSKATQQAHALSNICRMSKDAKPIWDSINLGDVKSFYKELAKVGHVREALDSYLQEFGGRFANELKLESVGIDEDPERLLAVLKLYKDYSDKNDKYQENTRAHFAKGFRAKLLIRGFKKYASQREEFRLYRSNTFAVVRRLFRYMGELLVKEGILLSVDDVFYLNLDEILDVESIKNHKLTEVVENRKRDYARYRNVDPPVHFSTIDGGLPSLTNDKDNTLVQGRPASPGKVRGKVRIFKEFVMPKEIDFDILVTSHTDPGWVPLIALSKGLIIEYGGVLSHASIVARELGIPAIIGSSNAVSCLKDGEVVEIDGSTGTIERIG